MTCSLLRFSCVLVSISMAALCHSADADAADVYVSPRGRSDAGGTPESPCDLDSTLAGRQHVGPGDTVFLLDGTYRHPDREHNRAYQVRLEGTEDQPVHVRPAPGARARIDNRVEVVSPTRHCWRWDLEITVSEVETMTRQQRSTSQRGSHPTWEGLHAGGLHILGGSNCKYTRQLHIWSHIFGFRSGKKECFVCRGHVATSHGMLGLATCQRQPSHADIGAENEG